MVGIILAFTSYRWDLPLTMKSCFYPLIGEKVRTFVVLLITIIGDFRFVSVRSKAVAFYSDNLLLSVITPENPFKSSQIFGWLGDSIDILSIITTIFGVCTSLGLGAIQVNAGIISPKYYLNTALS